MSLKEELIPSIHEVLNREGFSLSVEALSDIGTLVATKLDRVIGDEARTVPKNVIYASELGESCKRKIWYTHNCRTTPIVTAVVLPEDKIRFMYGDIVESLILAILKQTRFKIGALQKSVCHSTHESGWEVRGRIDCTIDDAVVEIKSTTSSGIAKFKNLKDDSLGIKYLYQLGFYKYANTEIKNEAGFLVVNKTTGGIHYFDYTDKLPTVQEVISAVDNVVNVASTESVNVFGRYELVNAPHGNMRLSDTCSMCLYKGECFPSARTFEYSDGRRIHLAEIKVVPSLKEITCTTT